MYNVSAVSYLNTLPYVYGLREVAIEGLNLSLDVPSVCAEKLIQGSADIGLVPVAALPSIPNASIVGDFGIAADGPVRSVMLYSEVPLQEIKTIRLDYQSRTSVRLVQLLSRELWKITPLFENASPGFEENIKGNVAGVVIGDRTFKMNGKFRYTFDLSAAWKSLTGLPFVFAVWASNKPLEEKFKRDFLAAIDFGLKHKKEAVETLNQSGIPNKVVLEYLETAIHFELTPAMKSAQTRFLSHG